MDRCKWTWKIDLDSLAGKYAHLETKDGVRREGRITSITMRSFRLNGRSVQVPESFELNGDPVDLVAVDHLAYIDFDGVDDDVA